MLLQEVIVKAVPVAASLSIMLSAEPFEKKKLLGKPRLGMEF
jgi:hypothetical protein